MDLVRDPYTGKMVDRRTGLPVPAVPMFADGDPRLATAPQPEYGPAVEPPPRVNYMDRLLNGTGVSERIMAVHQLFNPVTALAEAGQQSQLMFDPATTPMGRVAALGGMLTGMAGTVAPMWAASRGAVPTTNAMVDALTGINMPGGEFLADEFGGVKMPGKDGITAYHGSPHSFDRFSMDKIGTGEGAQAYGHGLYFAENEGVAKAYKETLSREYSPSWRNSAGEDINIDALASSAKRGDPLSMAATALRQEKSVDDALELFSNMRPSAFAGGEAEKAEIVQGLQQFKAMGVTKAAPGSMYEVRINANPDDFLDWDKPLSEQPAKVRGALTERANLQPGDESVPAKMLYLGEGPTQATERLKAQGIPGIKYLDAGSRGAGDGSRNYVVFDENLIEIVKKYGIAGAAAMLGVTAMDVEAAMAGQQP